MLVRIAASAVILLGCAYLGIVFSNRYKKRVRQISGMEGAMTQLEFDIDYMNLPLCDSLEKIAHSSENEIKEIFLYVCDRLKENPCGDMYRVWKRALERCEYDLYLTEDDKRIILDFSRTLGSGNREKEKNNIKVTLMRLKMAEDEAKADAVRNVKMYRGLGMLLGVFAVIVLL